MNYFKGYYFKCQSQKHTVAVIPALHETGGKRSCSIQLLTESENWNLSYPIENYLEKPRELRLRVGKNLFCKEGIHLGIHEEGIDAVGTLRFHHVTPLQYPIMGPFCLVPFMECRHSVYSMRHWVDGKLTINGNTYLFKDGLGYLEGDRGRSFPSQYIWSQCHFGKNSLMLSVAEIPLGTIRFTGVISAILFRGKEYRLATYLGAKAVKVGDGEIILSQGDWTLRAKLLEKGTLSLQAPKGGNMTRLIRENPSCKAYYSFYQGKNKLFSFLSDRAAFEYEYER